ncbi:hypothetical protein KUCAC02_012071 [Chaenocephalus aceratus]|uniref:Uncharacterized protein n=1 Tax=Chaenocephalus aceratus TaxID=36190 RepID=A0ACB9X9G8_CHAAC|nr:hypothetical protein KUCAC02_012071 [Chaenocephalus aceratus]
MRDSEEPSNKRVKPVVKSNSLTGVITPVKTPALKRIGQSISRSISFRTEARPLPSAALRPRTKASSFPRRRNSQCWSDTVESHDLTAKEIKRQEVIYELTQGERQLIDDLSLVKKVYYEPMLKLDILTESERGQIFGTLDSLIPLHQDLLSRLERLRGSEKTVGQVGPTLMDWFPCLEAYVTYCCNQESSFSRKLDLWNFLDLPRSRLVKYPLLLKEIQKCTPPEHPDEDSLPDALDIIQSIVAEVNKKTGEAECQFYRRGLAYIEDSQRLQEIQLSRFLYCHGELKNNKGQRLHVFLFELALVLSRPTEDKDGDGEPGGGGSFRGAFTGGNDKVKNCFRVQQGALQSSPLQPAGQRLLQQAAVDHLSAAGHPDLSLSSDTDLADHNSR